MEKRSRYRTLSVAVVAAAGLTAPGAAAQCQDVLSTVNFTSAGAQGDDANVKLGSTIAVAGTTAVLGNGDFVNTLCDGVGQLSNGRVVVADFLGGA